jgi:hypothetical protein
VKRQKRKRKKNSKFKQITYKLKGRRRRNPSLVLSPNQNLKLGIKRRNPSFKPKNMVALHLLLHLIMFQNIVF